MFPAARKGDPITHDLTVPCGLIGPPVAPCSQGPVMIEMLPAAHVNCTVICSGVISGGIVHPPPPPTPPVPIVKGSMTVLIHGMPAARWSPAPDMGGCGVFLGDPKLAAARTVLIGDSSGGGGGAGGAGAAGDPMQQSVAEALASRDVAYPSHAPEDYLGPVLPRETRPQEPTWIGIFLKDFDGTPIANKNVNVTLNNGDVRSGRTDAQGYIRFDGVRSGNGDATFVEILDQEGYQSQRQEERSEPKEPEQTIAGPLRGKGEEPQDDIFLTHAMTARRDEEEPGDSTEEEPMAEDEEA